MLLQRVESLCLLDLLVRGGEESIARVKRSTKKHKIDNFFVAS